MTTTPPRYTLQDVKQAANGHWDGILTALGIPAELLDFLRNFLPAKIAL